MLKLKPLSVNQSAAGAHIPANTFIKLQGVHTPELAHLLDSLVRVSRRVKQNHIANKSGWQQLTIAIVHCTHTLHASCCQALHQVQINECTCNLTPASISQFMSKDNKIDNGIDTQSKNQCSYNLHSKPMRSNLTKIKHFC